ncbi:MAG: DUF3775 domain-containing protein [Rhodospirillaceae bacterium]|nr:DUF3775 domain-containing protein [Rhodospirillaceae bacterium]
MPVDIAVENVCFVITKARELMADVHELQDEPGHHSGDDLIKDDLPEEDAPAAAGSAEYEELKELIEGLSEDDQFELIALAWIGRGTFTTDDWDEAAETAQDEHARHPARYLMSMPLLADYLEESLNEFGLSCEGIDEEE